MELTYRFNLSLAQHLDPKQIVELYSAQGQRWSRVSREQMAVNYTKVMSPKLQSLLQQPLPQQPTATAATATPPPPHRHRHTATTRLARRLARAARAATDKAQ